MYWIFLLLPALMGVLSADEKYENVINLCDDLCTCVDEEDIYILNCSDCGIRNVLAEWPTINKTLRATFSFNKIERLKILPRSDAEVEIVYSHCSITYLDPGAFEDIPNLKFLDLSYNNIASSELGSRIFKMPEGSNKTLAMTHLDLSYNQIHTFTEDLFEHLVVLEELNLEGNDFKILDHSTQLAISSIKTLRKLNMANNELTELVGNSIDGLEHLVEIDLSNNNLDFVPFTLVNISVSLEKLTLTGNPIFEITDESFLGFKTLRDLIMNNMPLLKTVTPNSLAPLVNLKKLELSNNPKLDYLGPEVFAAQNNLMEVYLNNNSFIDIEPKLLDWSKLRIVQFSENPLRCSCNLLKIKESLNPSITQELDGPRCIDVRISMSRAVFSLTQDLCDPSQDHLRIETVNKNFGALKISVIVIGTILATTAIIITIVATLRWRKKWKDTRYPFVTQVKYNPVHS